MKPNTPHSAYHVARPSVCLTCMYMYLAATDANDKQSTYSARAGPGAVLPARAKHRIGYSGCLRTTLDKDYQ
ncbi:hypothetical protein EVAR_8766_1 [Eumeta japonica]|uniref:Uncharacterized protein n=1 Tax=Eumeta variegata TaxID=151549 RepID=A0A4C1TUD8_EUMVA|nr:hypothetical protein EVAR_8766_1 [Eumeta japonica]